MQFDTNAVHVGLPRGEGQAVGLDLVQSATFEFDTLEAAAEVFQGRAEGLQYSRVQNPTVAALEARVNALENAAGCVVTATGQAATTLALINLCKAGDHIVATASLFGGSLGLLRNVMPNFGITSSIVDNNPEAIQAALQSNTRLVLLETIGNPAGDLPDFAAIATICKTANIALVVDNTWGAAGYLCRPLEIGADVVVHSLTKWASGHGTVLGGAVLVRQGFVSNSPTLNEPDASGTSWNQRLNENAFIARARFIGLHQMGMTLSPASAWQINLGLETLAVRVQKECDNAAQLAAWLETHPGVAWVNHSSRVDHPHHARAKQYLRHHPAVLTFGVKGGQDGASRFIQNLQLVRHAANLGDTRTMVVHPWTTTHGRLPEAGKRAAGVAPETIRVSVGLEDIQDLQADFGQALEVALATELVGAQ